MYQEKEEGFQWGPFILGILFVIVGIIAFRNPAESLSALVWASGIIAVLKGIFELVMRSRLKDLTPFNYGSLLVLGILDIIIGVIILFNHSAAFISMPYIFGIWFIFDSIMAIANAGFIRQFSNTRYWITIILGILGIIIGFMMFFNPLSAYVTIYFLIGIYFVFRGISLIILAF